MSALAATPLRFAPRLEAAELLPISYIIHKKPKFSHIIYKFFLN